MVEEQINVDYTVNSTIFPISMVNSDIFVNLMRFHHLLIGAIEIYLLNHYYLCEINIVDNFL